MKQHKLIVIQLCDQNSKKGLYLKSEAGLLQRKDPIKCLFWFLEAACASWLVASFSNFRTSSLVSLVFDSTVVFLLLSLLGPPDYTGIICTIQGHFKTCQLSLGCEVLCMPGS